jgi:hypothetical protein
VVVMGVVGVVVVGWGPPVENYYSDLALPLNVRYLSI